MFNIFINELIKMISNYGIIVIFFADDAKLYVRLVDSVLVLFYFPRDAMLARFLLSKDVRLSVRHTPVLRLNDQTYRKTFSAIWQPHHSSFSDPCADTQFQVSQQGRTGWEQLAIFDRNRCLSRKRCESEIGR